MSWKDDTKYLRSIGGYIALAVFLFLGAVVAGFRAAEQDPTFAEMWMGELEMMKWIMGLNPLLIMLIIFLKNLLACSMAILLGVGLGLVPLIVVTSNGVLIGVVSHSVIQEHGLWFLIAGLAPHGIIELPIVLVSIALGFRLGHLLIYTLVRVPSDLAGETKRAMGFLAYRVVPLLFLAAVIETFITPLAISRVMV